MAPSHMKIISRPVLTFRGGSNVPPIKTKIIWDEAALLDPQCCRAFQEALATLPVPAWEVSVDAHCQIYEGQYLQLARQFFL